MKLNNEKYFEKLTSSPQGKLKLLKLSNKIINFNCPYTNGDNYLSNFDEKKTKEYLENINSEKIAIERDKLFLEIEKNKQIRDEAKIYYEFSIKKASQREKELRNKILLSKQKFDNKDFDILKTQINNLGNQIVGNIADFDKDVRVEMKKRKQQMNTKLSFQLFDIEKKYINYFNNKYNDRNQYLIHCIKQMKDMEKIKEDYNKIKMKSDEYEILNNGLKHKISDIDDKNFSLKNKIFKLMKILNFNNSKSNEEFIGKSKKGNISNFCKMKKIIDGRIMFNENNKTCRTSSNLSFKRSLINNNNNDIFMNKRNSKSKSILKNMNFINILCKPNCNLRSSKSKGRKKIVFRKSESKEKEMFAIPKENNIMSNTSRNKSTNTQFGNLRKKIILSENKSLNDNKDSDLHRNIQNLSSDTFKNINTKEIGNFENEDIKKRKFKTLGSNNKNNQVEEEYQFIKEKDTNKEYFIFNDSLINLNINKYLKNKINPNNKLSEFDFQNKNKGEVYNYIENNIELEKIKLLLNKVREYLQNEHFVRENPRIASTLASYANILNNLKEKFLGLKKFYNMFDITSKNIFEEVKGIVKTYKRNKIEKSLKEKFCVKKNDLVIHKIKEGMTFSNVDSKKFLDLITNSQVILKEYENSTFNHIIRKKILI